LCGKRRRSCPQGKIERFIEPCLLLLLSEKKAHGYELLDNLDSLGIDPRLQDPGQIYRYLRRMEQEDLLKSVWETGESGPARRLYCITEEGEAVLSEWIKVFEKRIGILQSLIKRYYEIRP
jgi:PadR family transcriptional regulator, regulatory protein PadR